MVGASMAELVISTASALYCDDLVVDGAVNAAATM